MLKDNHKIVEGIQKYFLLGVLLLLIIILIKFLSPFIANILIAAVVVTAVYPLHKLLYKKVHIPRSFSAFISLLLVATIVIFPFVLFIFFISDQAADAYISFSDKINLFLKTGEYKSLSQVIEILPFSERLEDLIAYSPFTTSDIIKSAGDFVGAASSFLLGQTTNILKNLSLLIIHLVVFLMIMFYLLRDGDRLVEYIRSLLPLSPKYRSELINKMHGLSYGLIYGIFGAAIIQGLLVGIGFTIVGIGDAAFWGVIAALFSPVPYIGTALVWMPAVISLFVMGTPGWALFLAIWSIVIVGLADNVVKPLVIGQTSALHPLAVLLVLLGGVFTFGAKGLLFGPFVLTLTLAFLHIYQLEYKSILKKGSNKIVKSKLKSKVKVNLTSKKKKTIKK